MDWWMTGFAAMAVGALVMLCLGLWLGYRWGRADREDAAEGGSIVFPAQSADDFWANVKLDTAGLSWEEIVPAVRQAREALPPGRATDFIEQLTADTDRWIATMRGEDERG